MELVVGDDFLRQIVAGTEDARDRGGAVHGLWSSSLGVTLGPVGRGASEMTVPAPRLGNYPVVFGLAGPPEICRLPP